MSGAGRSPESFLEKSNRLPQLSLSPGSHQRQKGNKWCGWRSVEVGHPLQPPRPNFRPLSSMWAQKKENPRTASSLGTMKARGEGGGSAGCSHILSPPWIQLFLDVHSPPWTSAWKLEPCSAQDLGHAGSGLTNIVYLLSPPEVLSSPLRLLPPHRTTKHINVAKPTGTWLRTCMSKLSWGPGVFPTPPSLYVL